MTDNFLGEIRLFSCNFAPAGWALCNGALLQVKQNAALFSLIGNSFFGGDGVNTFALPDLRGRVPIHFGTGSPSYAIGNSGGLETVTINATQMPAHNHSFAVYNGLGTVGEPNDVLAIPNGTNAQFNIYNANVTTSTTLNAGSVAAVGGGQAHNNMQPFLTLNFCIAVQGIYPPRP